MKKLLITILSVLILVNAAAVVSFGAGTPPDLVAETAVLIDASTGQILYDKNMNDQRYPASTTKVMTALLALENLDLSKTVTIDAETPYTEGSRIYLLEGEQVTVEQLLNAMMTESANDAAVALGKEIAGTIPDFAKMMNEKAKKLGAKNTNFVNPNGLHDDAHVTTAYDLAMIAQEAMKNEKFRELVLTYRYIIPATNKQDIRYLYNTNRLIYDERTKVSANGVLRPAKYEGATGIKTGYTSHAGGCLIAGAKRGETELISVVMKSTDSGRFGDSIALLDYGFENYKSAKAIDAGTDLGQINVSRGSVRQVGVVAAQDGYVTLPIEASAELIKTKVLLDEKVKAPVTKGQKVGVVEIYEGDSLISKVDAIAAGEIPEGGILSIVGIPDDTAQKIEIGFAIALIVFLLLSSSYILLRRRQMKRRRKRRLERELKYQREQDFRMDFRNHHNDYRNDFKRY
ncbi:D-alanyl-D-alanine carboxypeptidase family protein [Sinanaerobacter chloroacetimidivorans]|uniref:serine-type D-Ala-D-Ala carboxypeptidase n=1 Tax=Sinanaerobacter chloroacetimidivorans TaxID=2818044 RepID=A0A8J7W1J3_9FIRM|nr:D-alanyl-D-alanine carboxypeptidase family protein [Sinanaerobacter chloroacetimidivorans]MBR0597436.1 D-alanyl-D-alanine carboxypeptidase [Sinanaerobacter chloroacetimidivorans]